MGDVVIKLAVPAKVDGFTVEHIPKSISRYGHIDSAPKHFQVLVRSSLFFKLSLMYVLPGLIKMTMFCRVSNLSMTQLKSMTTGRLRTKTTTNPFNTSRLWYVKVKLSENTYQIIVSPSTLSHYCHCIHFAVFLL